jgi:hypothetical protein
VESSFPRLSALTVSQPLFIQDTQPTGLGSVRVERLKTKLGILVRDAQLRFVSHKGQPFLKVGWKLPREPLPPPAIHFEPAPLFGTSKRLQGPVLEYDAQTDSYGWREVGYSPDQTSVWEIWRNVEGVILEKREVSCDFASTIAALAYSGPLPSRSLSEVSLYDLSPGAGLSNERLKTFAQNDPLVVIAQNSPLDFSLTDPRFDQIQAHADADEFLRDVMTAYGVPAGESPVQMTVRSGQASNRATYWNRTIRIGAGDGIYYQSLPRDPTVVLHEVAHSLIDQIAGLATEGEGGALNEGFADYFAASFLDRPRMGELSVVGRPYVRTLENDQKRPLPGQAITPHGSGQVISGLFWELRAKMNRRKVDLLAFRTLERLGPAGDFSQLAPCMKAAAEGLLEPGELSLLSDVLVQRGF